MTLPSTDSDDGSESDESTGLPFKRASAEDKALALALGGALRVARLHAVENVVAVEARSAFLKELSRHLARHDRLTLAAGEDRLSIDGAVVRQKRTGRTWLNDFLEFLARMGVGGLVFDGTWTDEALVVFLQCFGADATEPEERVQAIAAAAALVPLPARVIVLGRQQAGEKDAAGDGDEDLTETEIAAFFYARLLAIAEASYDAVGNGRSIQQEVRDLRQTLTKVIERSKATAFHVRLLALTAYPEAPAKPLARHAVDVTILVLGMGRLLGLARGPLADLGFAAFFHDIGRTPEGWRTDAKGGEDQVLRHAHVVRGITDALAGTDVSDAGLLRLIVVNEHHRRTDGFPKKKSPGKPHLYSRIVGIADAFDRFEKGASFRAPVSPAAALRKLEASPERFEPALVALLQDVIGRYPRGTLLQIAGGAVAIVIDGGARWGDRPVVRRLVHPDGTKDELLTDAEIARPELIVGEVEPNDVSPATRRAVVP
jgi:HD-GYP domain-containing protein (c-di-GMP phosphodiesterase class II)